MTLVYALATVWTSLLLGAVVVFFARSRGALDRILAFDTFTLLLVGLLVVFAYARGSSDYLDAALMVAVVAFLGTLAAVRYREGEAE